MLAVFVAEVCRKLRPARKRRDAIIGSPAAQRPPPIGTKRRPIRFNISSLSLSTMEDGSRIRDGGTKIRRRRAIKSRLRCAQLRNGSLSLSLSLPISAPSPAGTAFRLQLGIWKNQRGFPSHRERESISGQGGQGSLAIQSRTMLR